MKNGLDSVKIIGAHGTRHQRDFYPTPQDVTEALMAFLSPVMFDYDRGGKYSRKTIWEPACGDGAISRVLERHAGAVYSSDIREDVYGWGGVDFLTCEPPKCDWIITNPPWSLAEQFIRRCGEIGKPFALLLKTQYWHSARRLKLFRDCPPGYICPLTWRPDFDGRGAPLIDVMWCVWGVGNGTTRYEPLVRNGRN